MVLKPYTDAKFCVSTKTLNPERFGPAQRIAPNPCTDGMHYVSNPESTTLNPQPRTQNSEYHQKGPVFDKKTAPLYVEIVNIIF